MAPKAAKAKPTSGSRTAKRAKAPAAKSALKRKPQSKVNKEQAPVETPIINKPVEAAPIAAPVAVAQTPPPITNWKQKSFVGAVKQAPRVEFSSKNPTKLSDKHHREFGDLIAPGRKVKILTERNPRKGPEIVMRGIVKSLTTVGAWVFDPERDKIGMRPEWFAFKAAKTQMVLG